MTSSKKKKAQIRNWSIYRLRGIISSLKSIRFKKFLSENDNQKIGKVLEILTSLEILNLKQEE